MKDFLSLAEAALELGVSQLTIYRMVRDGQLPAVRVRQSIRIPADALRCLPSYVKTDEAEEGSSG
jgi:excisionase family DNA binding protein